VFGRCSGAARRDRHVGEQILDGEGDTAATGVDPSLSAESAVRARHTSVHKPAMSSTRRPVASTAGLMSAHALVETRSMGTSSGKASLIWPKSGSLSGPPLAPTVVRIVGTSRSLAAFASAVTLLTRRVRSVDWTENATHGWWSIRISTELSMVIRTPRLLACLFAVDRRPRRSSGARRWWSSAVMPAPTARRLRRAARRAGSPRQSRARTR
jgi:hypothetical protein